MKCFVFFSSSVIVSNCNVFLAFRLSCIGFEGPKESGIEMLQVPMLAEHVKVEFLDPLSVNPKF